jgi:hypothetical protein
MHKVDLSSKEVTPVSGEDFTSIKVGKNGKPIAINSSGSLYWPEEFCDVEEEPFEL